MPEAPYGYGAPGSRQRDEDGLALFLGTELPPLPIRPMFGWERARASLLGEGSAGDYLQHLRNRKEEPMELHIIISGENVADIVTAVLDLSEYDGISVRTYEPPEVMQPTPEQATKRFSATHPADVRRYLEKAIAAGAKVMITYHSTISGQVTVRKIAPLKFQKSIQGLYPEQHERVLATDVDKNAVRSFRLDSIQEIIVPVL